MTAKIIHLRRRRKDTRPEIFPLFYYRGLRHYPIKDRRPVSDLQTMIYNLMEMRMMGTLINPYYVLEQDNDVAC